SRCLRTVLRRIFGPKRDEVTRGWRKLHNEELHNLYSYPSIRVIRIMMKSRRTRWAGHVTPWKAFGSCDAEKLLTGRGGNDVILGEVGRATAVPLVGTYHRPGMRWGTALGHFLVVPPGNDGLGRLDQLVERALIYVRADQQSGQWLIKAIVNHRLKSGTRLKATDARNLPKPVKVALRTKDKIDQNQEELLKWITDLNPGLHTENWRVLDKQSQTKGERLILFIDRDSHTIIQRTGYKIFTGLSQGTVKVLDDPEVQRRAEPVTDPVSSNSVSEEEGDEVPSPPDDQSKVDQGTPLHGTQSENGEGHRMEIDPSSSGRDHEISSYQPTPQQSCHGSSVPTAS
ncbi:hypothetical protein B7P43_G04600, partial [Cryptotermes secundus]